MDGVLELLAADAAVMHSVGPERLVELVGAAICGAVLGYERESRGSPAGMKTCTLVCIGATLYIQVSHALLAATPGGDATRMASQIVSGIGFLGAGAILRGPIGVSGLTSAATIWFIGAVGVIVGCGRPISAFGLTLVVVVLLRLIAQSSTSADGSMRHACSTGAPRASAPGPDVRLGDQDVRCRHVGVRAPLPALHLPPRHGQGGTRLRAGLVAGAPPPLALALAARHPGPRWRAAPLTPGWSGRGTVSTWRPSSTTTNSIASTPTACPTTRRRSPSELAPASARLPPAARSAWSWDTAQAAIPRPLPVDLAGTELGEIAGTQHVPRMSLGPAPGRCRALDRSPVGRSTALSAVPLATYSVP